MSSVKSSSSSTGAGAKTGAVAAAGGKIGAFATGGGCVTTAGPSVLGAGCFKGMGAGGGAADVADEPYVALAFSPPVDMEVRFRYTNLD
jgi:hypothetical protein